MCPNINKQKINNFLKVESGRGRQSYTHMHVHPCIYMQDRISCNSSKIRRLTDILMLDVKAITFTLLQLKSSLLGLLGCVLTQLLRSILLERYDKA